MKATHKNFKQSPRKVRRLAKFVRQSGKSVAWLRVNLSFMDQKAATAVLKLIDSALANAGIDKKDTKSQEGLYVKEIRVDEGMKLKRWMPRAFGRATPYKKRYSHITLVLDKVNK